MNSTAYLYGVNPKSFKDLPYKDALIYKYKAGKILKFKLTQQDTTDNRIDKVEKALKHTEKLLEELGIDKRDLPSLSESILNKDLDREVDSNLHVIE